MLHYRLTSKQEGGDVNSGRYGNDTLHERTAPPDVTMADRDADRTLLMCNITKGADAYGMRLLEK
ncbi:unnamed protein product [Malus baccata var. baccata]